MVLELDLTCIKIKWCTKFQLNISKHVGEKCGKLWRTDGRRPGRTDGHHHTLIRPVWRRAYKNVYGLGQAKIGWQRVKNCMHVWKTRNLSFEGKTLIIKSLIYSVIGYEIEIRGIPDIYMKEINTLVWNFLWDNKTNRIERNVCCLEKEEGGLGMVNLEMIINTKQINTIYQIIHSSEETWNAIGKYWLTKYDTNFDQSFFMCYCTNYQIWRDWI